MHYAFICKNDINYTNRDRFRSNGLAVVSPGALAERKGVVLQNALSCAQWRQAALITCQRQDRAPRVGAGEGGRPAPLTGPLRDPDLSQGAATVEAGWVEGVQVRPPLPSALGMNPRSLGERSSALTTAPAAVERPRDLTSSSWELAAAT